MEENDMGGTCNKHMRTDQRRGQHLSCKTLKERDLLLSFASKLKPSDRRTNKNSPDVRPSRYEHRAVAKSFSDSS